MNYSRMINVMIPVCTAIFILLSACLENPLISTYHESVPDTVEIKVGNSAYFPEDSLLLDFIDVINDGRCPLFVQCFWEGQAEISLGLRIGHQPKIRIPLKIFGYVDVEDSARHVATDTLGYQLKLLALNPYPVHPGDYDFNDYTATISIAKKRR